MKYSYSIIYDQNFVFLLYTCMCFLFFLFHLVEVEDSGSNSPCLEIIVVNVFHEELNNKERKKKKSNSPITYSLSFSLLYCLYHSLICLLLYYVIDSCSVIFFPTMDR